MSKITYVGGFLPFLDPLHTIKTFSVRFPHKISHKIAHNISHKNFPQDFPAKFSHKISRKIFPQDFPELDPDWLAPHHPIPDAKFPPITAFLKLAFFPSFLSHKIFLQDFPARIFHKIFPQDFSELDPDWLVPNHPIPNATFPPITALLNMSTYHKSAKIPPPPFPQISWEPQINE